MISPALSVLLLGFPSHTLSLSRTLILDQTWAHHQQCLELGGNGQAPFRPDTASSITVHFRQHSEPTIVPASPRIVSVVVFELGDEHLGGIRNPETNRIETICTPSTISLKLCRPDQQGEFLISAHAHEQARNPFLTRAVNLTTTTTVALTVLQYPVHGPGFYCVAAVPYHTYSETLLPLGRGDDSESDSRLESNSNFHFKFQAAMVATDPSSGGLPTFRVGLLRVYRLLSPWWLALTVAAVVMFWGGVLPLFWVTAAQVAARWASLEAAWGEHGLIGKALRVVWYGLFGGEMVLVVGETMRVAGVDEWLAVERNRGGCWRALRLQLLVTAAGVMFGGALVCGTAWADWTATTASSRLQGGINVCVDGALTGVLVLCTARLFCRRAAFPKSGVLSVLLTTRGFQGLFSYLFLFICLGIMFALVAAVNGWALIRYSTPQEYTYKIWALRFWLVDGANEFLFLVWAVALQFLALFFPLGVRDVKSWARLPWQDG